MTSPLDARIEVARGEMVIGDTVVPIRPEGAAGEWRVGGSSGPVLRPLRYGERTRLCALAAMSREPHASLGAATAKAATVADGDLSDVLREVAALLLCGAREPGASFSETTLCVARAAGWDPAQITGADATEIDRLAVALGATAQDTGWRRLVLENAGTDVSLATVRDQLADHLLSRVEDRAVVTAEQPEPFDTVAAGSASRVSASPDLTLTGTRENVQAVAPSVAAPVHVWLEAVVVRRAIATANERGQGSGRSPAPAAWTSGQTARAAVVVGASALTAHRSAGPAAAPAMPSGSPDRADRLGLAAAAAPVVPIQSHRTSVAATANPVHAPFVNRSAADLSPLRDAAVDTFVPDVADALAALLEEEADLRGLE